MNIFNITSDTDPFKFNPTQGEANYDELPNDEKYKFKTYQGVAEATELPKPEPVQQVESAKTPENKNPLDDLYQNTPQIDENTGVEENRSYMKRAHYLLGLTTPELDTKKAERLKKIAGINAAGNALSTLFSGIYAAKTGSRVPAINNQITNQALAEYNAMIEKDKENKYRTALAQAQAEMGGLQEEMRIKQATKMYNAQQKAETYKAINKFNFDKYLNDEKYRNDYNLLAAKAGFDLQNEVLKGNINKDRLQEEWKNRYDIAQLQAQTDKYKVDAGNASKERIIKHLYPDGKPTSGNTQITDKPITFKPSSGGKDITLTPEQVGALYSKLISLDLTTVDKNTLPTIMGVKGIIEKERGKGKFSESFLKTVLPVLYELFPEATQYSNQGDNGWGDVQVLNYD